MAETHENPWPDEHHGGPPPGAPPSDLPADLSGEVDEPAIEIPAPADPEVQASVGMPDSEPEPQPEFAETPLPQPFVSEPSGLMAPVFPMALGALMLVTLVCALFVSRKSDQSPTAPATAAASASVAAPAPAAAPVSVDALSGDVQKLRGDVDGLAHQIEALGAKVAALPKPPPPPDLKPLEARIEGLGKTVAPLAGLSGQVARLDKQLTGVDATLKTVGDKATRLEAAVKKATTDAAVALDAVTKPAAAPARAAASAAAPKPADDPGVAALAEGTSLFKASNFAQAAATFKKAIDAGSKDARVFYYAALSRGLSSNDWRGDTESLVTRGAELEKAGTPRQAEIEAAFSGLSDDLKRWLSAYRNR